MTSTGVPQQVLATASPQQHPAGDRRSVVERCLEGDQDAWANLVQRYERLVYTVAVRQGLAQEDCADVTQTVFEALFLSLPTLRNEDRLASWLVSVTKRQAWRARRRRMREVSLDGLTDAVGPRAAEAPLGGDLNADLDRNLWVYEALQGLPEPCRTLLVALYFDPAEPSYAEVALRLKRPLGSIGPTRARCLDHLRRVLQADGERL